MQKVWWATAWCVVASLSVTGEVLSAPSGLNVIPTTDVLNEGQVSLETESSGRGSLWSDDCDRFALLQVGIGKGMELGVDRCIDDPDTWLNFKWQVRNASRNGYTVALGVQAISDQGVPQPYFVGTRSIGATRLHAGGISLEAHPRWIVGMDRPAGKRLTVQADYTSGRDNSLTYGVALSLPFGLSLTVARSAGNAREVSDGHLVNLAWLSGRQ